MLNPDANKDAANLSETISSTGSGKGDKTVELLDVNKKNIVQFASETELTNMAIPFDRQKVKFSEYPMQFIYNDIIEHLKAQEKKYYLIPKAIYLNLERDPFD